MPIIWESSKTTAAFKPASVKITIPRSALNTLLEPVMCAPHRVYAYDRSHRFLTTSFYNSRLPYGQSTPSPYAPLPRYAAAPDTDRTPHWTARKPIATHRGDLLRGVWARDYNYTGGLRGCEAEKEEAIGYLFEAA